MCSMKAIKQTFVRKFTSKDKGADRENGFILHCIKEKYLHLSSDEWRMDSACFKPLSSDSCILHHLLLIPYFHKGTGSIWPNLFEKGLMHYYRVYRKRNIFLAKYWCQYGIWNCEEINWPDLKGLNDNSKIQRATHASELLAPLRSTHWNKRQFLYEPLLTMKNVPVHEYEEAQRRFLPLVKKWHRVWNKIISVKRILCVLCNYGWIIHYKLRKRNQTVNAELCSTEWTI